MPAQGTSLKEKRKPVLNNLPVLFCKKIKHDFSFDKSTGFLSTLWQRRHFVPASQEWYNSIYTYNKNYPKSIPVADISLMKLFKGYFNYGIRLFQKNKSILCRALPMRYRLLSTKKAFVGKGDLKHTNNKVIITFYLYNAQEMFISDNFNSRVKALLLPNKSLKREIISNGENEKIILYNRMFNIFEFLALDDHYLAYYNTMASIIKKRNIVLANLNYLLAIYIYILKNISLLNKNNCNHDASGLASLGSTKSLALEQATGEAPSPSWSTLANPLPLGLSGGQEGEGGAWGRVASGLDPCKILSDINSFFTWDIDSIYNKSFKDSNLFFRFFNKRLAFYRLNLKTKFPFLITNDILKISPSTSAWQRASGQEGLASQAISSLLPSRAGGEEDLSLAMGPSLLSRREEEAGVEPRFCNLEAKARGTINIFNFEYFLYKMSLSYLEKVFLYWKLIRLNKVKNTVLAISKFIHLIEQIYHKKIVLNIVNLKKMHLNSHIYTEIVSLKLRNRDNKLYRILKASFRKVKIEDFFKIYYKKQKKIEDIFRNKLKNRNLISSMFNVKKSEYLQDLLFYFFPDIEKNLRTRRSPARSQEYGVSKLVRVTSQGGVSWDLSNDITKYVLKFIKHIKLRGIRVEAKGRLTRPRTAARSVFKMRYLGGLKNLESSFIGLSQIMLRGDKKSNVSYSIINSKGRNGSFGVKGWVSSK